MRSVMYIKKNTGEKICTIDHSHLPTEGSRVESECLVCIGTERGRIPGSAEKALSSMKFNRPWIFAWIDKHQGTFMLYRWLSKSRRCNAGSRLRQRYRSIRRHSHKLSHMHFAADSDSVPNDAAGDHLLFERLFVLWLCNTATIAITTTKSLSQYWQLFWKLATPPPPPHW
jgi:hypothetical protein